MDLKPTLSAASSTDNFTKISLEFSHISVVGDKVTRVRSLVMRFDYVLFSVSDPGSGAFLTPGSGIRDPGWV